MPCRLHGARRIVECLRLHLCGPHDADWAELPELPCQPVLHLQHPVRPVPIRLHGACRYGIHQRVHLQ